MADDPNMITMEQASRLLMIGPERIRQHIKAGFIPRGERGRVSLVGAVQGYIKFLQQVGAERTKGSADQRVRDARAKEIETRTAERLRELIPLGDALLALDLLVGRVKEETGGIAARVTRDLDLRRKIEAEINGAQARIADALRASADIARTGRDPSDAGPADDA